MRKRRNSRIRGGVGGRQGGGGDGGEGNISGDGGTEGQQAVREVENGDSVGGGR